MKLRLNLRPPTIAEAEKKERAKSAEQRKKTTETVEQAWERIGSLKLNEKERGLYELAKEAFFSGRISRLTPEKKLAKDEVMALGLAEKQRIENDEREGRIAEVLTTKPANFHILTDDSELPAFVDRLRTEVKRQMTEWKGRFDMLGVESMTAGDFEGTGIDSYIDLSIGFSIWLPILDEGYYLPYGHVDMRGVEGFEFLRDSFAHKATDSQLTRSKVLSAIKPYLSQPRHGKTFHMGAARYDLHVAQNDGYTIKGCVWDTLDAMYLLNEHEEAYGLKPLVQKYGRLFGIRGDVYTFEDMFGNRSPAPFSIELVGIYAIKDVLYGWKMFEWQFETMQKVPGRLLDCYAEIDSKLPETDVFLERCGFIVDLDELTVLESEFTEKIEEAKRQVFETYRIDAEFVRKMDRTINANKIANWIEAQKKRITTLEQRIQQKRDKLAKLESANKTHLKMYANEREMLEKYEKQLAEMPEPTEENAPQEIESFELTNGNHIQYLIYDYLGIEDRTGRIMRGKKRSTAADVLEMYYEDEEALKPLAVVAEYEKLLNTYVQAIPNYLEADGRLHSNFKAGGTATGRYSSSSYSGRPIDILDEFRL